jgi:hypothetical protein
MTPRTVLLAIAAPGMLAAVLAGCSTSHDGGAAGRPSQMGMNMGGNMAGGMDGGMAQQRKTCELHRRIMHARTPEERQAIIDHALQGMTPELRERHLQAMERLCTGPRHPPGGNP